MIAQAGQAEAVRAPVPEYDHSGSLCFLADHTMQKAAKMATAGGGDLGAETGRDEQLAVPGQRDGEDSSGASRARYPRPRVAWREARQWDHDQAAAEYNSHARLLGADLRGDFPMTGAKLREYEEWPEGGLQPSAQTISLLARAYGVQRHDLLDRRDYERLPSSERFGAVRAMPAEKESESIVDSVVGQATAAIALLAAVIYAAGGLTLGLKLWFMKVPWAPVLGQLPRDFIVITAVGQVILPCVIAGAALGALVNKLGGVGRPTMRPSRFFVLAALMSVAAGAVLGLVPVGMLLLTSHAASGVLQPRLSIYLCCGALSVITFFPALYVIRRLYKPDDHSAAGRGSGQPQYAAGRDRAVPVKKSPLRCALAMAMASFAVIPCLASVSGALLLPPVVICGPTFLHPVNGQNKGVPGFMRGNLIGSNGQWAYIAQFQYKNNVVYARTITAVPVPSIRLEGIGQDSGCGDLSPK